MQKTKTELFLELAKPNKNGVSRWVQTNGNSIDAIRLNGFNIQKSFNQSIRKDIKDFYKDKKCVMLGVCGKSENTKIEIDHKDGRKNDFRVADLKSQNYILRTNNELNRF